MHLLISRRDFSTSQPILRLFNSRVLNLGYPTRSVDLAVLRWGYKKARELGRRLAFYRGDIEATHPRFPEGSKAAINASTAPVDISSPDIIYSAEDNEAIDTYHRETGAYIRILVTSQCSLPFSWDYMAFRMATWVFDILVTNCNTDGNLCDEAPRSRWGGRP